MIERAVASVLILGMFTACGGPQRPDPDAVGVPSRTRDAVIGTFVGMPLGALAGGLIGGELDARLGGPSEDPGLDGMVLGALTGVAIGAALGAVFGHHEDERVRHEEAERKIEAK